MKRAWLFKFNIFMIAVIMIGLIFGTKLNIQKFNLIQSNFLSENVDKKFKLLASPEYQKKKAGETAEIKVSISNIDMGEVGLNNIVGYLLYDDSILEEVNIIAEQDWHFEYNQNKNHEEYGKFVIYTMNEGVTSGQDLLNITAKIKDDVTPQTTQIKFVGIKSSDGDVSVEDFDVTAEIEIYSEEIPDNPDDPTPSDNPDNPTSPDSAENSTFVVEPENANVQEKTEHMPDSNKQQDWVEKDIDNKVSRPSIIYSIKTGDGIILVSFVLLIATVTVDVMVITKNNENTKRRFCFKIGIISAISVIAVGLILLVVTSFAKSSEINDLKDNLNYAESWLDSKSYLVTDDAVSRIAPLTSISELSGKFNKEIDVYKKDTNEKVTDGNISTGMRITDKKSFYNAIVLGDINGDGKSDHIDFTRLIRNVVNNSKYSFNNVEKIAADMSIDKIMDMNDIDTLVQYMLYGNLDIASFSEIEEPNIEIVGGTYNELIGAYEDKVTVRVTKQDENAVQTKYKIEGTRKKEYDVIESGETFEINDNGVYKISAYNYGEAGNRSKVPYKIIVRKNPNNSYKIITRSEDVDGTYSESIEEKIGRIGTEVVAGEDIPEGYELNEENSTLTGIVKEDEITELIVTLNRKEYTLTLESDEYISSVKIGDESSETTINKSIKFGKSVDIFADLMEIDGNNISWNGWISSNPEVLANQSVKNTTIQMPKSDITLTATTNRQVLEYTVNYNLNGGQLQIVDGVQLTNPNTYTVETETFTLNNPIRNGYRFVGWTGTGLTQENEFGEIVDNPTENVTIAKGSTGNRAYRANWVPEEYSIRYNLNDGKLLDGKTNPDKYNIETPTFTLNNPIKTGYRFAGWTGTGLTEENTSGEVVDKLTETVTVTIGSTGDRNYTANWVENTGVIYHVKYFLENINSDDQNNKDNYTLERDLELSGTTNSGVEATIEEYTGFTFDVNNPNNVVSGTIASDGSLVLEVYYTRNSYELTLDKDDNITSVSGDKVDSTTLKGTYKYEEQVVINASVEQIAGYTITFDKWVSGNSELLADKENATEIFNMPAGDIKYTATATKVANEVKYYVEYYYQEDGIYKNQPNSSQERSAETGTNVEINSGDRLPSMEGYVFDESKISNISGTVAGDGTLVLKVYFKQHFTITYKPGTKGSFEEEKTENLDYGAITPSFNGELTHEVGYVFDGWSTVPQDRVTSSIDYVATWREEIYNITYNLNGGDLGKDENNESITNPSTYTISTETFSLHNPTKSGYVFKGWTGEDLNAETEDVTISKGSTGNKVYTANWEVIDYEIGYELNGGSLGEDEDGNLITNPEKYNVETPTFALNNPDRVGYTFLGWVGTDYDEETTFVTIEKGSTGNRNYEAVWRANTGVKYIVRYYAENLNSTDSENKDNYTLVKEVEKGGVTNEDVTAEILTFTGFKFDENNSNNKVTNKVAGDGSLVLEMYYTRNSYTLILEKDDNVDAVTGLGTYKYEEDVNIDATLKTETGYEITFFKWASNTAHSENADYLDDIFDKDANFKMPAGDVTLTATSRKVAIEVDYKVEFYYEVEGEYPDQAIDEDIITRQAQTGTTVYVTDADKTTTRPTYVLDESKNGNLSGIVNGDGSLILKVYFKQEFSVTYAKGNHGTFETQTTNNLRYNADTPAFIGEKEHEAGYEFTGWDKTVDNKVTNNAEYVAQWSAITYEIGYDLHGGTLGKDDEENDIINPNTYTVETETFTVNNPTKVGYTFKGWTGTGIDNVENPEQTVPREIITIIQGSTGNKNYEAVWEPIKYSITYDLDGGTLGKDDEENDITNPDEYTIGHSTFTLNNPTKSGYTFLGWTGTGIDNVENPEQTIPQETVAIAQGSIGNRNYKANWQANPGVTYHVQYFMENIESTDSTDANNYTMKEDRELDGTTNEYVTAEIKSYVGFTYDENNQNNVKGGNIDGEGKLTLKVYYTRNTYTLTMEKDTYIENVMGVSTSVVTGNAINETTLQGTFKYQEPIQINATVKTETGYTITFNEWVSSSNEIFEDEESNKNAEMNFKMPAEDITVTATSNRLANTMGYIVEYYYEGDSGYSSTPEYTDETRSATVASTVNVTDEDKVADARNQGYEFDESADNVLTATIPASGVAILKVHFKKAVYTLNIVAGDKITQISLGEQTAGEGETLQGTYMFGESVTIDATVADLDGYDISFEKWKSSNTSIMLDNATKNLTFDMPAGNITLTAIANIIALDASYKVEYYYQESGVYPQEPNSTITRQGKTGNQASISSTDKEPVSFGYVYDTSADNVETTDEEGIKADGSTTLKLYFKEQFTVTYLPGEHANFEESVIRNNDYNSPIPQYAGSVEGKDGYAFDYWKLTKINETEVTEQTEIPTTVKANLEYTAQWKVIPAPVVSHTPTTWTNQNVTITIASPDGYETYNKEYRIGDSTEWRAYEEPFEVEQNSIIHARLVTGSNKGEVVDYEITNIDKIGPQFTTLPTYEVINNVATVNANVTDNLSGIVEYGFKEESYSGYTVYTCSSTLETSISFGDIHTTGRYIIYVKDSAGNSSTSTIEVLIPVHNVAKIISVPQGYESLLNIEYESLEQALSASDEAATNGNVKIEIIDYIDNEENTILNGRNYTINLNNYYIKNQEAKPVFKVNGKLQILNEALMGDGTVASPFGVGVHIALGGEFTLGSDDGTINAFSPIIEGLTYGVDKEISYGVEKIYNEEEDKYYYPEGVFNFYDGKVIGGTTAFNLQKVNDTPLMYDASVVISASTDKSEATLTLGSGQEAVIGKRRYQLLEDAINDANNTVGNSNTQVEIKIVKDITKDASHKIVVDETKNIKLDLNGYTFTTSATDYVIENYGKLEIYDSKDLDRDYIHTVAGVNQFSSDLSTWHDCKNQSYNITQNSGVGTLDEDGALVFDGSTTYKINNWDKGSIGSYEVEVAIDENFKARNSNRWYECSCILGCNLTGIQKEFGILVSYDGYYSFGYDSTSIGKSDVKANDGMYHKLKLEYTERYINFYVDGIKKVTTTYSPSGEDITEIGIGWNCSATNTAIKGRIKSVKIEKLYSGIITSSKANTIYNGISENATSNLQYEDINLNNVVANDENYYFMPRGAGSPGLISTNYKNSKTTARSYIEVDLTNKKGMYEIYVCTETKGSSRDHGYVVISNSNYNADTSDTSSLKVYTTGSSAGGDVENQFSLAGGNKYYIHFMYYNYNSSSMNTSDCFMIKSMKIAKIDKFGELKITSGTIENTKTGSSNSFCTVIENESILTMNNGCVYTNKEYSTGISNGKNTGVGYTEINSGNIYTYYNAIYSYEGGLLKINGGDIWQYKNTWKAIYNLGNLYVTGENTKIYGSECIRNESKGYVYIDGCNMSGATGIYNNVNIENYNNVVIDNACISTTSYGINNSSKSDVVINNIEMSSLNTNGNPLTTTGILNSSTGKIIYNDGNMVCYTNDIYNSNNGVVEINGGNLNAYSINNTATTVLNSSSTSYSGKIYINGGTILGKTSAIENKGKGTVTIVGGQIESTNGIAIKNLDTGIITIGIKDGNVNATLPVIKSPNSAISSGIGDINFYDGVLIGQENYVVKGSFSDLEDNKEVLTELKSDGKQYVTLGVKSGYVAKISNIYNPDVTMLNEADYKYENNNYYFKTLNSAIDVCSNTNATIIDLIDNINISRTITIDNDKDITIEFNDKTILALAKINFSNNGKLKLQNSNVTENTYGNIIECSGRLIENNIDADVIMDKISISYLSSQGSSTINSYYRKIINNYGNLSLLNSLYYIYSGDGLYAHGIYNNENGKVVIENTSVSGDVNYPIENAAQDISEGVYAVSIKNSTFTSTTSYGFFGLTNSGIGTIYVEDSTINSRLENNNSSSGSMIINNSTLSKALKNSSNGYILVEGENSSLLQISNSSTGEVDITGGTVEYSSTTIDNSGTLTITGGTIKSTSTSVEAIKNQATGNVQISGKDTKIIGKSLGISNAGNMTITGASIKVVNGTNNGTGIKNTGTLTIGKKNSIVDFVPIIYGGKIGINNSKIVYFYDGIVDGLASYSFSGTIPSETENDCIRVVHAGGTAGEQFDNGTVEKYSIGAGREISILAKVDVAYVVSKDEYYTSISEAFSNTDSIDTVRLIHDVSVSGVAESAEVVSGKNITLDLNGFNIVAGNTNTIVNNGTLKLTDSTAYIDETSGEIVAGSFLGSAGTILDNNSICTIETGKYELTIGGSSSNYCNLINNTGTMVIEDGNYYSKGNYDKIINCESGTVTINGGTYENKEDYCRSIYCNSGSITINSGLIKSAKSSYAHYMVYCGGTGSINIKGGTIEGNSYAVYNESTGSINMSGGTLNGSIKNDGGGIINFSGGTCESTSYAIYNSSIGTTNITGGEIIGSTCIENRGGDINIDGRLLSADSPVKLIAGSDNSGTAYGIFNYNQGEISIKGHVKIDATYRSESYGIYSVYGGTINLGDSSEITNNVKITSTSYGIYNFSGSTYNVLNYYGGTIKSPKAIHCCVDSIPTGYDIVSTIDEQENEIYEIGHNNNVASVGETEYDSLQEAFNNCSDDTVVLLKNIVIPRGDQINVGSGKNAILNLNGKTISVHNKDSVIKNEGTLKIKDESTQENGKIKGMAGVLIENKGNFYMISGTIHLSQMNGNMVVRTLENGKIQFEGGKIEALGNQSGITSYILYSENSEEIKITGGTLALRGISGSSVNNSTNYAVYTTDPNVQINVSGARFENLNNLGRKYSIYTNGGSVNLSSNMYSENDYGVYMNGSGSINIYDSVNLNNSSESVYMDANNKENIENVLNVYGGSVSSIYANKHSKDTSSCTLNIRGGVINGNYTIEGSSYSHNVTANIYDSANINANYNGISYIKNVNVYGGDIVGKSSGIIIESGAIANVTGGTVTGTDSCGIKVKNGTLTIGENNGGYPNQESPAITGAIYGVEKTGGTFNFYDGIITGATSAIKGDVDNTPEMFTVIYSENDTIAKLGIDSTATKVAKVNGVNYDDFESAIRTAININGTVEICKDITIFSENGITIPANSSITIDMCGFSITGYTESETLFTNNGSLSIIDSTEDGTNVSTIRSCTGKVFINNGTLVLGNNDETVYTNAPKIIGTSVAITNEGTFDFVDGQISITEASGNIIENNGTIRKPNGYNVAIVNGAYVLVQN